MAIILNPEQAKEAARTVIEQQEAQKAKQKTSFESLLKQINEMNPDAPGFEAVTSLLSLPEESFAILAPIFLNELEKGLRNTTDQLFLVQSLNLAGATAEDLRQQFDALCTQVDESMADTVSKSKRDFLKRMLGMVYNVAAEAEGIAKKSILIPIELCDDNAKIPNYANLADAGMDLYAIEDVDINPGETVLIPTGIKVAIPAGYALLIHPRSGKSLRSKMRICNSIGLIDAGYRGEIGVIAENIDTPIRDIGYHFDDNGKPIIDSILHGSTIHIDKGERFAQARLVEVPKAVFYKVDNIEDFEGNRGGGFGSTGQQ